MSAVKWTHKDDGTWVVTYEIDPHDLININPLMSAADRIVMNRATDRKASVMDKTIALLMVVSRIEQLRREEQKKVAT